MLLLQLAAPAEAMLLLKRFARMQFLQRLPSRSPPVFNETDDSSEGASTSACSPRPVWSIRYRSRIILLPEESSLSVSKECRSGDCRRRSQANPGTHPLPHDAGAHSCSNPSPISWSGFGAAVKGKCPQTKRNAFIARVAWPLTTPVLHQEPGLSKQLPLRHAFVWRLTSLQRVVVRGVAEG